MSTEPRPRKAGTGMAEDAVPQQAGAAIRPGPAEASADAVPGDQRATAVWVEAADASGTLKATRDMPEPDSPGG